MRLYISSFRITVNVTRDGYFHVFSSNFNFQHRISLQKELQPFWRQMEHYSSGTESRAGHQQRDQQTNKKRPFGFDFKAHLGLWQTQALIKTKKNKKSKKKKKTERQEDEVFLTIFFVLTRACSCRRSSWTPLTSACSCRRSSWTLKTKLNDTLHWSTVFVFRVRPASQCWNCSTPDRLYGDVRPTSCGSIISYKLTFCVLYS